MPPAICVEAISSDLNALFGETLGSDQIRVRSALSTSQSKTLVHSKSAAQLTSGGSAPAAFSAFTKIGTVASE